MLGITSFLSQISLVAAMAAINNMLRKYGALDEIFGQAQYAQIPMAVVGILTLPMPKGRGFSVLPSQPCICKVLYKVPERSVRACPALP